MAWEASMSSLESAIRILHCLSADTPRLRVTELSDRLSLPKSTVSRLLKTLSEGGVLDRDPETKEYVAGPITLQLGGLYMAKHDLLDLVDDAVRRLVEQFRFTGYVAVLDQSEAVVLRCRQGAYPLKFVLEVGTRQPAAEAALGIGLLAQLGEDELSQVLAAPREQDSYVHPTEQETRALIAAFRRDGWVAVPCLSVPGITAIGSAVIVAGSRQPAIGFSVSFPDSAVDRALRGRIAAEVCAAARKLTSVASRFAGHHSPAERTQFRG
jgi:DNA-binding IclR family transcriptional regulator